MKGTDTTLARTDTTLKGTFATAVRDIYHDSGTDTTKSPGGDRYHEKDNKGDRYHEGYNLWKKQRIRPKTTPF